MLHGTMPTATACDAIFSPLFLPSFFFSFLEVVTSLDGSNGTKKFPFKSSNLRSYRQVEMPEGPKKDLKDLKDFGTRVGKVFHSVEFEGFVGSKFRP